MTPHAVIFLLAFQLACALSITWDIVSAIVGLPPPNWQLYELVQIGAAVGLFLGVALSWIFMRQARRRTERAETALRAASGAFMEILEERFEDWGLTPAESDVALFSIKGLSIQDIARLRGTSEGTVKAQTAAIYRKAGVTGRPQLLSLFIEELMDMPDGRAGQAG